MSKIYLELEDTGNATANLVLFMNAFLDYARTKAGLSPTGIARFVSVFRDGSKIGEDEK